MTTETVPTHVIGCIFDSKAGVFMKPFLFRSKGEFIRSVQIEAKNPESMLNKFAADYDLCIMGEWSEFSGIASVGDQRLGSVLDLCPLN